jgi:hypothetical protein
LLARNDAAASLIEKLTKAHAEGRLEDKFKLYTCTQAAVHRRDLPG